MKIDKFQNLIRREGSSESEVQIGVQSNRKIPVLKTGSLEKLNLKILLMRMPSASNKKFLDSVMKRCGH